VAVNSMTGYPNEIVFRDTQWWIVARGRHWGPFDYQWSGDLRGVEFLFRGIKFGEVCSRDEFFADLAPFRLPISVCRISAIVAGTVAVSVSMAESQDAKVERLTCVLNDFGFERFLVRQSREADSGFISEQ